MTLSGSAWSAALVKLNVVLNGLFPQIFTKQMLNEDCTWSETKFGFNHMAALKWKWSVLHANSIVFRKIKMKIRFSFHTCAISPARSADYLSSKGNEKLSSYSEATRHHSWRFGSQSRDNSKFLAARRIERFNFIFSTSSWCKYLSWFSQSEDKVALEVLTLNQRKPEGKKHKYLGL